MLWLNCNRYFVYQEPVGWKIITSQQKIYMYWKVQELKNSIRYGWIQESNYITSAWSFSVHISTFRSSCCLHYWTNGDPWQLRLAYLYSYQMQCIVFVGPGVHSDWTILGGITKLWTNHHGEAGCNMLIFQAYITWLPLKMNVSTKLVTTQVT